MFRLLQRFKKYEGRFLILFGMLVLILLLTPYISNEPYLIAALFIATPLAGVHAASYNRRNMIVAVILLVPAVVLGTTHNIGASNLEAWIYHLSATAFYGYTAVIVVNNVLRQKNITPNTIYGALSAYLLLGLTWSFAYAAIEGLSPGSFYVDPAYDADGVLERRDFLYYSFVTLTTLGYGDILPLSAKARSMAALEAICGVLYTATLVASLVGRMKSDPDKTDSSAPA